MHSLHNPEDQTTATLLNEPKLQLRSWVFTTRKFSEDKKHGHQNPSRIAAAIGIKKNTKEKIVYI